MEAMKPATKTESRAMVGRPDDMGADSS